MTTTDIAADFTRITRTHAPLLAAYKVATGAEKALLGRQLNIAIAVARRRVGLRPL